MPQSGYLGFYTETVDEANLSGVVYTENDSRRTVLPSGIAAVAGRVFVDGRPAAGVRLKLLFRVCETDWAVTDNEGRYQMTIPSGSYEYYGYALDRANADKYLAGRISAGNEYSSIVDTNPDTITSGPTLFFSRPIRLNTPVNQIVVDTDFIMSWYEYPGAARYSVLVSESKEGSENAVSPTMTPLLVDTTTINFSRLHTSLRRGVLYTWVVNAYDSMGHTISYGPPVSARLWWGEPSYNSFWYLSRGADKK